MGIQELELSAIARMAKKGMLPLGGNIAEMGAQQLHLSGRTDPVLFFLRNFSVDSVDSESLAQMANNGFAGELFKKSGFQYTSFDVAPSPYNTKFNLNVDALPDSHIGKYDLVTNFGTTEHVFDQVKCFRAIHDLTKIGGIMFHVLPLNIQHGLISYTTRFADLLVSANEYEIIEINYNQEQNLCPVPLNIVLCDYRYREGPKVKPDSMYQYYAVSIICRKISDKPFQLPLDVAEDVVWENRPVKREDFSKVASIPRHRQMLVEACGRELLRELAIRVGRRIGLNVPSG